MSGVAVIVVAIVAAVAITIAIAVGSDIVIRVSDSMLLIWPSGGSTIVMIIAAIAAVDAAQHWCKFIFILVIFIVAAFIAGTAIVA